MNYFMRCVIISMILSTAHAAALHNLENVKNAIEFHYEQGGYAKELQQIAQEVRARFSAPAAHAKQVIIFDIDEVALSAYPWYKERDFGMTTDWLFHCWRFKTFPATPAIKALYDHFRDLGYAIIFLTARYYEFYEPTHNNLRAEGYTEFERLITRSPEEVGMPVGAFKELARSRLVEQGYEIICCIDDNSAALQGKHVGHPVKIPNYLY